MTTDETTALRLRTILASKDQQIAVALNDVCAVKGEPSVALAKIKHLNDQLATLKAENNRLAAACTKDNAV